MSTERDELVLILANAQRRRNRVPEIKSPKLASVHAFEEAEAILAAGYRKIFDGDCGLGNAAPDERDAAEAWMRWANILTIGPDEERNGIAAMRQMLTEFGYRKPRTITTVEELDALATGAAVQTSDDTDTVVLKSADGRWRNQDGADLDSATLWRYGTHPFMLIFEPSA